MKVDIIKIVMSSLQVFFEVEEIEVTAPSASSDDHPMPIISSWIDHLTSPFQQSVMGLQDEIT